MKARAYIIKWGVPFSADPFAVASYQAEVRLPPGVVSGRDAVGVWIEFEVPGQNEEERERDARPADRPAAGG